MLRAPKASHENHAVKAHSQDLIRFLRLISLANSSCPADFAASLQAAETDVEHAILPARPLSVITSAVNSYAVTWVQSVRGICATRGCVLLLAGAFLGLHWCRRSALCFASSLLKRTDTSRAIHRTTRSAIRTFCLRLGLRV